MRIPGVETNLKQSQLSGIEPRLIAIIEKFNQQPLLLDKLTLSQERGLSLFFDQKAPISQIQLPLQDSRLMSSLNQGEFIAKLAHKGDKLLLELIPVKTENEGLSLQKIQLQFQLARLTGNSVLLLSRQSPSQLQPDKGTQGLGDKINTSVEIKKSAGDSFQSHNSRNLHTSTQSLVRAVEQFLTLKPLEQPGVTQSVSSLLDNQQRLFDSFFTGKLFEGTDYLPLIDKQAISELLSKLSGNAAETSVYLSLKQLLKAIEQLTSSLDFSSTNRKLDIEKRFASSGHFLESKLSQTADFASKSSRVSQRANTQNPAPSQPSINIDKKVDLPIKSDFSKADFREDLKFNALQIKQSLENLIQGLSLPRAQPIKVESLLYQLAQQIMLLEQASRAETTRTHGPIVFAKEEQSLSSKVENLFQSSDLKRLPWSTLLNADGKKPFSSQVQENSLLNLQRSLLSEMRHDINATLNKIETNQLLSMRSESTQLQQFLVELPILRAGQLDSFELLFEGNKNAKEKKKSKTWTVTVKFDLKPLGPMFARVSLKNERISSHFYAQDKTTAKLLTENLQHLKDSLFAAGVNVDEIQGQQGLVPSELVEKDSQRVDLKV